MWQAKLVGIHPGRPGKQRGSDQQSLSPVVRHMKFSNVFSRPFSSVPYSKRALSSKQEKGQRVEGNREERPWLLHETRTSKQRGGKDAQNLEICPLHFTRSVASAFPVCVGSCIPLFAATDCGKNMQLFQEWAPHLVYINQGTRNVVLHGCFWV